MAGLLELTQAEAKVALLAAAGVGAGATADTLGVSLETVKSHLRAAFAKVGVRRARDLGRLAVETASLSALSRVAEIVPEASTGEGRLRLLRASSRTVACIDYGGAGLKPLFVTHGFAGGRRLPPGLVSLLREGGWRPVVPQRPGYGLTDAADADAYDQTAGADMSAIADALQAPFVDVLARDSSSPALFALAARRPGLVGMAALLNPKSPANSQTWGKGVLAATSRFLMQHPAMILPFTEMLRRQMRTEMLEKLLARGCRDCVSDQAAIADPAVMRQMVEDIQALASRSSAGVAAEQALYASGWTPTSAAGVGRWAVGFSAELDFAPGPPIWREVLGVTPTAIDAGGYLVQFSHPQALVALLGGEASATSR